MTSSTGFVYDDRYLLHQTGRWHPETPDRIRAISEGAEQAGLFERVKLIKATPAKQHWVEAIHPVKYIMRFEEACFSGMPDFDHPDNPIGMESFQVALLAAGGVLNGVDAVMEGRVNNAFCVVRPPGHHAEQDKAMGFCFFNNVAIAARYLQSRWGVERVGIIDIDVHHGNGTQHLFEDDDTVFYYSIHQHPSFAYPGTGREFETGRGKGLGYTLNSTVLPGEGDKEYKRLIRKDLIPAFEAFKPQVILVSTGFDAHEDDDMSDTRLSTGGYTWLAEKIMELARLHCDGRVVSVLEGGYNLDLLPELVINHVNVLMG